MIDLKALAEILHTERQVFELIGVPWPPPVERTDLKLFSRERNLSCGMFADKILAGDRVAQVWPLTFGRARLSIGFPGVLEPDAYERFW